MLDQRAFQAHFPDDPVNGVSRPSSVASQLNSPELIEALAALEKEFLFLAKFGSPPSR
jgi:hypothetical protein